MNALAFSIYDMKTGVFGTPFFALHIAQAVRSVADVGQDLGTTIGRHPEDYTLYRVGRFDDQTGMFVTDIEAISTVPQILEMYRPKQRPLPLVDGFEAAMVSRAPNGRADDGNGERA